jgi:hypothetical protein
MKTLQKPMRKNSSKLQSGWVGKLIVYFLAFAFLCLLITAFLFYKFIETNSSNPLFPPEMAAAKFSDYDVRADLGGMLVKIPSHFANYVEYNGDPGFGEKRVEPKPVRNQYSKLTSFGFEVRFPDMVGLSSPELRKDKESYNMFNTPWIDVGITTGEIYSGDHFLDRQAKAIVETPNNVLLYENYEQLPQKEHELTAYAAKGINQKTQKSYREDEDAKDVFIYRSKNGEVETYIACSNRPGTTQRCKHSFTLEPKAKAEVYVSYRRKLLPEWKKIQSSVQKLIFSFETKNTVIKVNSPTSASQSHP